MSAAPESLSPFASRGLVRSRPRLSRRWENTLIVLGICLPVPLFAATGLSVPLPATVERIAAALVPWADTATLDENQALAAGASGSIVRAPGERAPDKTASAPIPAAAANPRPSKATSLPLGGDAGGSTSQKEGGGKGGNGGSGGGSGGGGAEDPGQPQPPGPTAPVQNAVKEVADAAQPVVDQVQGTVTGVTGSAGDTVDGLVSGLGK
jgi:hypothetical protein